MFQGLDNIVSFHPDRLPTLLKFVDSATLTSYFGTIMQVIEWWKIQGTNENCNMRVCTSNVVGSYTQMHPFLGTNIISPTKALLKMIFPFPLVDMLVSGGIRYIYPLNHRSFPPKTLRCWNPAPPCKLKAKACHTKRTRRELLGFMATFGYLDVFGGFLHPKYWRYFRDFGGWGNNCTQFQQINKGCGWRHENGAAPEPSSMNVLIWRYARLFVAQKMKLHVRWMWKKVINRVIVC